MARSNYPAVPTSPPRLTGDKTRDILALLSWQQDFYRITVQEAYFASTETVAETSSGLTESLSLPQSDALAFVKNDTDDTKQLRFDASQIAAGATRVLAMPDSDVDLGTDFAAASHVGSGGAAHAVAGGSAGFMSAADKTKLDGIEALADVTDETNVTAAFPLVDTTALVYDPVDPTKLVRIDVGAVATLTTRVLAVPDQDVDFTPGVTFEAAFSKNTGFNLNLGTSAGTVAEGNHLHTGVYEPADATILKDADIGVTVQAFDATNALTTDITYGTLDANGDVGTSAGQLAIGNHLHAGVYEPVDSTLLRDADIGVSVQAHDADTAKTDVAETITARYAFNGGATGVNSPFTVDSTFVVANLNADLLDGNEAAAFALAGHAHAIDDLSDVVITTATTGQVLKYNGTNWINDTDATGGSSAINDLSDVTITTPADNEVLAYDSGSATWINQTASEAGLQYSRNAIINGACQVAQRTAPSISGSYQYGQVDRIACAADGAPTAGTIAQATGTLGTSGYMCHISGLSTGAGGTAKFRYRIESRDSERFISAAAIFSCNVNHDVGSAVDYTITVNKANAADDFSAITNISTGSATSVATGTDTQISLAVGDMGDCTNGIEIIVSAACGSVTTKNFYLNELQLGLGSVVTAFDFVPFVVDDLRSRRYYHRVQGTGTVGDVFGVGSMSSTTIATGQTPFPTEMRIAPTALEQSGTAGDYRIVTAGTSANCTSVPTFSAVTKFGARSNFTGSGHTAGQGCFIAAANSSAFLAWSAEL